ncbi:MAG: hypothetical protein ABW321_10535, partial [Polyangiales bacterium]
MASSIIAIFHARPDLEASSRARQTAEQLMAAKLVKAQPRKTDLTTSRLLAVKWLAAELLAMKWLASELLAMKWLAMKWLAASCWGD